MRKARSTMRAMILKVTLCFCTVLTPISAQANLAYTFYETALHLLFSAAGYTFSFRPRQ